jgi:hypothetical protein
MNKIKSYILIFAVCGILISVYGCGGTTTPVTPPTTITVSGKVLDTYGNPITVTSTVVIGTQSKPTAGDGSFTINNVTTPYDVWVLNPATGVFGVKGLTIANPYIPGAISPGNTQSLLVTIPLVPAGSKATVIFQDTVTGKVSGFGQVLANSQTTSLSIGGVAGQTVAGKLYLIEYNISGGVVSSYSGYAEQQAAFTIGSGQPFTFNTIGGGLGQATISGTVNSSGGTNLEAQLYLNFGSKNNIVHRGGFIQSIVMSGSSGSYSFVVPTGGTTSTTNLNVVAITPNPPNSWVGQRMLTVQAGTTGSVINIDSPASILTPGNGATGVDTTTLFSYSGGSGNAIHFVRITPTGSNGKTYQVLTNGTSFNFPNLATYGYNFASGQPFSYMVSNNLDITNVNDYCAQLFDLNPAILGTVQSTTFNFTAR